MKKALLLTLAILTIGTTQHTFAGTAQSTLSEKKIDKLNEKLLKAASKGKIKAVKKALNNGADINTQNDTNRTPLHIAVDNNDNKIIDFLLKNKNIQVNAQDTYLQTPLHIATYNKHIDITKSLLKHPKINVNLQDYDLNTPLHRSIFNRNPKVIELLLEHPNIQIDIINKQGKTPLLYIATLTLNYRHTINVIEKLLEYGANLTKETLDHSRDNPMENLITYADNIDKKNLVFIDKETDSNKQKKLYTLALKRSLARNLTDNIDSLIKNKLFNKNIVATSPFFQKKLSEELATLEFQQKLLNQTKIKSSPKSDKVKIKLIRSIKKN